MPNLLILAPAPIAALAASRGSGVDNLATADPREVWADSAVGSAATIDVDFGVVRAVNTIFLGHLMPARSAATWSITGGVAGYAETVIKASGALRVPDVAGRSPSLSHALWTGASVNVRYLRLSVTQPADNPPLTAGAVLAGTALMPEWGQEWGSGRRAIDTGSATPLPDGGFAVVDGVRKSAWYWTLGDLTNDELDQLWEIALDRGETRPLLVVEDAAATAGLRRRIHYGKFTGLRQFERSKPNRNRWELQIEDWGAEETAPL